MGIYGGTAAGRAGVAFADPSGERATMDKRASMGGRGLAIWCRLRRHRWRKGIYGQKGIYGGTPPGDLVSPSTAPLAKWHLWIKGHLWGDEARRPGVAFDGTAGERGSMDKRASMEVVAPGLDGTPAPGTPPLAVTAMERRSSMDRTASRVRP